VEDDSTEKPLSIGRKGMLKLLELFTTYHSKAKGHPINDWMQVTKKVLDDFRSSNVCIDATEKDNNIALPSTSSACQDLGDFGLTDGETALHHVLFEVLCQPWFGPLVEALERTGFNEIQNVLLMNQAERDILTFLMQ